MTQEQINAFRAWLQQQQMQLNQNQGAQAGGQQNQGAAPAPTGQTQNPGATQANAAAQSQGNTNNQTFNFPGFAGNGLGAHDPSVMQGSAAFLAHAASLGQHVGQMNLVAGRSEAERNILDRITGATTPPRSTTPPKEGDRHYYQGRHNH